MTAQERRNALCNVTGETLWGFQAAMVLPTTVLTVLLTQLGASKVTIGLIPSLDGLTMFLSVLGIYLFRSHKKRKIRIIVFHYITIVPLLAVMGVLVLFHDAIRHDLLRILLIGGWALVMASVGVLGTSWVDWLAHLFRREIRGTVMGASWACSSVAGIAGGLTSGWFLHGNNTLATFGWLYVTASVFATLSITVFLGIVDPAKDMAEDYAASLQEMAAAARESVADRAFRGILIGRCLSLAGFCVGPFIALHYLSPAGGKLTDSTIVSLGAAQTAGAAAGCILFGRIGDRVGHRFGLLMGIVFQICSLADALLVPGPAGYFIAMLFSGCVSGTLIVSYQNLVIESCPHRVRAAHLMVGSMVVGFAGLLFPVIGARIALHAGISVLLEVSLAISVVALAWNLAKVNDPRVSRKPGASEYPPIPPHPH